MYNLLTRTYSYLVGIVALSATFVCAPSDGTAQSILLTAGDFAILGGTAITSTGVTGTTIISGNIGLSPGSMTGITGFPPAQVTSGTIIVTGATTGQARLDLIKAQVGLANMPSNADLSNVDLGGMTLEPGVYTFNGSASLNGALTLDAKGRNNAFWVFQIGFSFITSVNSSVTVINTGTNGGSDLGIFWNAGSAIVIGKNNQVAGNYLSGTSITFGSNTNGSGRALALAKVTLDFNSINAHGGLAGGDWTGGLVYNNDGAVVPVIPQAYFWSAATADFGGGWKWNKLFGYIYNGYFPFIYSYSGGEWLYIPSESESAGYFFWSYNRNHWCYTSPAYYQSRWFYDFTTQQWTVYPSVQ
ncbi:MAG: ice-binding family protein [Verrucomicrobiota bacterium]|nr:ice-binding family protein [Verrucomicrobiota bacterium]